MAALKPKVAECLVLDLEQFTPAPCDFVAVVSPGGLVAVNMAPCDADDELLQVLSRTLKCPRGCQIELFSVAGFRSS
ncbi:hypothetical protein H3V53_03325 [Paraburkholderia bengalensis]|uniref:Uncharacterized protein n=1 Tax=Paraburkholderia bengalensis TaxID=2747562 RepID=A0ABU8IL88_9BURK